MTSLSLSFVFAAQRGGIHALMFFVIVCVVWLAMLIGIGVLFRSFYKIPPPDHALIRSGHGGLRAAHGSGMFVIPIIHRADLLSLAPIQVDLTGTKLDAEPAASLQLPNVFHVEVINEHDAILVAAQRLASMSPDEVGLLVRDLILGALDQFLASAKDESSDESPAGRFTWQVDEILNSAGLRLAAVRR